jgi:hypothetical protein
MSLSPNYGVAISKHLIPLFPESLSSFINWKPLHDPIKNKVKKIPIQETNSPSLHMSLLSALAQNERVGIVINETHSLIALDIDDGNLGDPLIQPLLLKYPTYIEYSPSNQLGRFRILYFLDSKKNLKPKTTLPLPMGGSLEIFSTSGNYVTLTGNKHPSSAPTIATLSADDFLTYVPRARPATTVSLDEIADFTAAPVSMATLPNPDLWIEHVPCNANDPLVQKFCEKYSMNFYTYWLTGILSLRVTFGIVKGYEYANLWSRKSSDYNEEELEAKWRSFHEENHFMTPATYAWLFKENIIDWPSITDKGTPNRDELLNTMAFLDFHGMELAIDAIKTTPFLKGPKISLIPRYYTSENEYYASSDSLSRIAAEMTLHAREFAYYPRPERLEANLQVLLNRYRPIDYSNRFTGWLEELPPYDPQSEPDYLEMLATDIIQRDSSCNAPTEEFHRMLVRKWMLSLGRTFWRIPHVSSAEGMLILCGPPKIGKSSLGPRLLPPLFRDLHISVAPNLSGKNYAGMGYKDYKAAVCTKLIVDFDEADGVFANNSEADLKTEITKTEDTFRPAYGRTMLTIPRKYSIYASTNEERARIPADGERRYWWLNVKYVDTYALDTWPIDRLWKQIEYVLKSTLAAERAPWLLTEEESDYLVKYLRAHRLSSNLEALLYDEYDWTHAEHYIEELRAADKTYKDCMYTMKNIMSILSMLPGGERAKRPEVTRVLKRLYKAHLPASFILARTTINRGTHNGSGNQTVYFLPKKR